MFARNTLFRADFDNDGIPDYVYKDDDNDGIMDVYDDGLVGYAEVQINLKDINDNAPVFTQDLYYDTVV